MGIFRSDLLKKIDDLYNSITQISKQMIKLWYAHILFTWQWWLLLALTIIPWIFWIIIRKKESTNRLLFCAFFVIIISCWLDFIGIQFGLWSYYIQVIPFIPSYVTLDFSLLPVTILLVLQIKPDFNPIIKAICFSAVTSFIMQPIFVWLNIYNPRNWKHYYSFPIFIVIYLIAHFLSRRKNFKTL